MHPAISVIFFTVTSGAGFGAISLIGAGYPFAQGAWVAFLVGALAGGLAVAGLISSTFHLGHPERSLRAFSQWRSSWLSREGVCAVVTLLLFGLYTLIWMVTGVRLGWLGAFIVIGAVATVFTTAMIYTQLKTVPHWHTAWTPAVYLAFAAASGFTLMASLGRIDALGGWPVTAIAFWLLLLAWAVKSLWWRRALTTNLAQAGSTPETATGLGHLGKVRLLDRPHTGPNYLTKEMVHKVARKHANQLRFLSLVTGALAPIAVTGLTWLAGADRLWLLAAFILLMAGLIIERWLFFAEAEHSVSLYYE